jgi:hypothetical protein
MSRNTFCPPSTTNRAANKLRTERAGVKDSRPSGVYTPVAPFIAYRYARGERMD